MEGGANRRVYVGNLAWKVKWQDLKDHMKQAGEVKYAEIIEADGRSKGCGIVEYTEPESAERAIDMLNDSVLYDRKMFVREDRENRSHGRVSAGYRAGAEVRIPLVNDQTQGRQLYITNLPWSVGWADLKDLFGGSELVDRAEIATDREGRSKGFGCVIMKTQEAANEAIEKYNDHEWQGRKIGVKVDEGPVPRRRND